MRKPCFICGCQLKKSEGEQVKISGFNPRQETLEAWQKVIPDKGAELTLKDTVCTQHFREEDMISGFPRRNITILNNNNNRRSRRMLRKNAIPCLKLSTTKEIEPKSTTTTTTNLIERSRSYTPPSITEDQSTNQKSTSEHSFNQQSNSMTKFQHEKYSENTCPTSPKDIFHEVTPTGKNWEEHTSRSPVIDHNSALNDHGYCAKFTPSKIGRSSIEEINSNKKNEAKCQDNLSEVSSSDSVIPPKCSSFIKDRTKTCLVGEILGDRTNKKALFIMKKLDKLTRDELRAATKIPSTLCQSSNAMLTKDGQLFDKNTTNSYNSTIKVTNKGAVNVCSSESSIPDATHVIDVEAGDLNSRTKSIPKHLIEPKKVSSPEKIVSLQSKAINNKTKTNILSKNCPTVIVTDDSNKKNTLSKSCQPVRVINVEDEAFKLMLRKKSKAETSEQNDSKVLVNGKLVDAKRFLKVTGLKRAHQSTEGVLPPLKKVQDTTSSMLRKKSPSESSEEKDSKVLVDGKLVDAKQFLKVTDLKRPRQSTEGGLSPLIKVQDTTSSMLRKKSQAETSEQKDSKVVVDGKLVDAKQFIKVTGLKRPYQSIKGGLPPKKKVQDTTSLNSSEEDPFLSPEQFNDMFTTDLLFSKSPFCVESSQIEAFKSMLRKKPGTETSEEKDSKVLVNGKLVDAKRFLKVTDPKKPLPIIEGGLPKKNKVQDTASLISPKNPFVCSKQFNDMFAIDPNFSASDLRFKFRQVVLPHQWSACQMVNLQIVFFHINKSIDIDKTVVFSSSNTPTVKIGGKPFPTVEIFSAAHLETFLLLLDRLPVCSGIRGDNKKRAEGCSGYCTLSKICETCLDMRKKQDKMIITTKTNVSHPIRTNINTDLMCMDILQLKTKLRIATRAKKGLSQRVERLKTRLRTLKSKHNIENFIPEVPEPLRDVVRACFYCSKLPRGSTGHRYPKKWVAICCLIQKHSKELYKQLMEEHSFPMPSRNTILKSRQMMRLRDEENGKTRDSIITGALEDIISGSSHIEDECFHETEHKSVNIAIAVKNLKIDKSANVVKKGKTAKKVNTLKTIKKVNRNKATNNVNIRKASALSKGAKKANIARVTKKVNISKAAKKINIGKATNKVRSGNATNNKVNKSKAADVAEAGQEIDLVNHNKVIMIEENYNNHGEYIGEVANEVLIETKMNNEITEPDNGKKRSTNDIGHLRKIIEEACAFEQIIWQ